VRAQVITEDGLVEWLAGLVGTRVRMRVDQAGEQPAFGSHLGSADRVIGPPVTIREQVNNIAAGQGGPADPQDGHQTTLTAATGDKEAAAGVSKQALDERLRPGPDSLRRAAWAGLQDSMPRAALLSIHARVIAAARHRAPGHPPLD
jgi:hypothetical protein